MTEKKSKESAQESNAEINPAAISKNKAKMKKGESSILWIVIVLIVLLIGVVVFLAIRNMMNEDDSSQSTNISTETTEEIAAQSTGYLNTGEPEKAVEVLEDAIERTDDVNEKESLYTRLSSVYMDTDDYDEALATLQTALELDSETDKYFLYSDLASIAIIAGQNELAIEYTEKTIEYLDTELIDYELLLSDYQKQLEELKNE